MRQVISPNQTVLWTRHELTELYGPMTSTRTAPNASKPQFVIIPQQPRRGWALVRRLVASVMTLGRQVRWSGTPRSVEGLVTG